MQCGVGHPWDHLYFRRDQIGEKQTYSLKLGSFGSLVEDAPPTPTPAFSELFDDSTALQSHTGIWGLDAIQDGDTDHGNMDMSQPEGPAVEEVHSEGDGLMIAEAESQPGALPGDIEATVGGEGQGGELDQERVFDDQDGEQGQAQERGRSPAKDQGIGRGQGRGRGQGGHRCRCSQTRGARTDTSCPQNYENFDVEPEDQDKEETFQMYNWEAQGDTDSSAEQQLLSNQASHMMLAAALVGQAACQLLRRGLQEIIAHYMGEHKTDVLKHLVTGYSESTLARYIDDGGKFCLLAGAGGFLLSNLVKAGMIELDSIQGSVYLLVILAAAGMKTKIRCIAMDMILRLHHAIRRPLEGETEEVGKAVIEDLIPAISMLREQFDVRFKTMFSMTLLLEEQLFPTFLLAI
ncbi:hypothetical protein CPB84DRAFT_1751168 [Gymnopilus junonius]|uniref:Uncharacterized protein n=1 Tax=Gymnopilus junonius TaxID=109634 RepID=A0A9P5NFA2_GYMJU|nr:hypothetical protein CPB84DRAFT_1751168 [Gymnopilus junonius]